MRRFATGFTFLNEPNLLTSSPAGRGLGEGIYETIYSEKIKGLTDPDVVPETLQQTWYPDRGET